VKGFLSTLLMITALVINKRPRALRADGATQAIADLRHDQAVRDRCRRKTSY
jgi:hypothetical protein